MGLIDYFIEKKAQREMTKIIHKTKPFFQSPKGLDEILKSILTTNFPLNASEYVFGLKGDVTKPIHKYTNDRLNFLKNVFKGKLDAEKYLELTHSANVDISCNYDLIIHTHPESMPEEYLEDKFNFSEEDKHFSIKRPLGLIEYYLINSSDKSIEMSTRLSLCYLSHPRKFLKTDFLLNNDGTYISNDGEFSYKGQIPVVVQANEEFVTNLQSKFNDCELPLFKYMLHIL